MHILLDKLITTGPAGHNLFIDLTFGLRSVIRLRPQILVVSSTHIEEVESIQGYKMQCATQQCTPLLWPKRT